MPHELLSWSSAVVFLKSLNYIFIIDTKKKNQNTSLTVSSANDTLQSSEKEATTVLSQFQTELKTASKKTASKKEKKASSADLLLVVVY